MKPISTLSAAVAALLLAPAAALADDVSGTWRVEVTAGAEPVVLECNFSQQGEALGGTCSPEAGGDAGARPLQGVVEGLAARWGYEATLEGQARRIAFDGKIEGTTITGGVDYGGIAAKFAAVRK